MSENTPDSAEIRNRGSDRAPKRMVSMDYQHNAISFDGHTFQADRLPVNAVTHFLLLGLWTHLRAKDLPLTEFEEIVSGKDIGRSNTPPPLDPWREAAAWAHAEAQAKGGAIPRVRGVSLVDRPEFQQLLAAAREVTRAWKKPELDRAKLHPLVVQHHNRITKKPDDLAALFGAPAATDAAAEDRDAASDPEPAASEAA